MVVTNHGVFTFWNPDWRWNGANPPPQLSYLIYSLEEAENPEEGHSGLHIQGYFQIKDPRAKLDFTDLDRILKAPTTHDDGSRVKRNGHYQQARGTSEQAIGYVRKDPGSEWDDGTHRDGPWEFGVVRKIESLKRDIGQMMKGRRTIPDPYSLSYSELQHAEKLRKYYKPKGKREPPVIWWFWGPTGSGKTRYKEEIQETFGIEVWSPIVGAENWFDGYEGQTYAQIDDIALSTYPFKTLLQMCDRYHMKVNVKGESTWWEPKVIIFTASIPPEMMFRAALTAAEGDLDQLLRRINERGMISEFKKGTGHRQDDRNRCYARIMQDAPEDVKAAIILANAPREARQVFDSDTESEY